MRAEVSDSASSGPQMAVLTSRAEHFATFVAQLYKSANCWPSDSLSNENAVTPTSRNGPVLGT